MRYSGKTYLSDGTVTGEDPSTSTHWHVIAVDGVYSAVAGSGIELSGNTISVANGSITVEMIASDLANVINGKEVKSNKKSTLTGNEASNDYYPTTKAVADALSGKAPAATAFIFDSTTTTVTFDENNPKIIYLNATVDNEKGIVLTSVDNTVQYFFGVSKSVKVRNKNGANIYTAWELALEKVGNKKSVINSANLSSTEFYPSIKAVVDYLTANYIGNGNNTVSWDNLAVAVQALINGKESASNKLTSRTGIDSDSTDTEYPTAKAVYDFGADILTEVTGDLVLKENLSNKKNAIAGNETSEQYYPTTKAVYDYGSQISSAVEDVKAYIGYTSGDILGLHADFENKTFTRLGAAVGLNEGSDFDAFPMYGQRRRVVVTSDGEIQTDMDPAEITETDFDYDIMVYQPKFYYKVVPLKLEKQSGGLGYHIRKANYYITSTPHAGFKVHPLFIDKNGNEVDYVLFSAYEASYMYWHATSQSTGYYDIFHDGVDTGTTIDYSADTLKSLPGVKPVSGKYKAMTKTNLENCALRKSPDWHLDTIQSLSANQLLAAIELGAFNMQSLIGQGVVNISGSDNVNCSSLTGSTSGGTGRAASTVSDINGATETYTENGKVSVCYRGLENPWGNIKKQVNGINIWGDGSMNGGQVYIADDFDFYESKHDGNYKPAGFTLPNANGYISAFGYGSEQYDWLFIPSETSGDNALPVGDFLSVTSNLIGDKAVRFGGAWINNVATQPGGFFFACDATPGGNGKSFNTGGRLLFVPTASV